MLIIALNQGIREISKVNELLKEQDFEELYQTKESLGREDDRKKQAFNG